MGVVTQESHHHHPNKLQEMMKLHHTSKLSPNQCGSSQVRTMDAPLPLVWSMVRDFHNPQTYKGFVRTCKMQKGDGGVGSVRDISIISGLPAETSTERLDRLDDETHVMVFTIIGGDHGLVNYQSTLTLHADDDDDKSGKTVVIESYVVDVPEWSSAEDTCLFANTIIGSNLKNLAKITEKLASM